MACHDDGKEKIHPDFTLMLEMTLMFLYGHSGISGGIQGIRNNLISGSVIGICDLSKKIRAHLSNSCAGGYFYTKQRN